ncbi:MAG: hypothetical protein EZS28_052923 [Streblomastix strix]|uniref:Uncharacterized protein n=1 Tax=Streblomastix strix TaxID=222440 RepID=A0A5J4RRG3_9EUKA|nr:MAG: hypothetical protein EZS28_052923 [Streblomastix strix]
MPPPNSGSLGQPPSGQVQTGSYILRNAVIPQATIFLPALNAEQEIPGIPNVLTKEIIKDHTNRQMLKNLTILPVGKNVEGQYWPGFGPDVSHATDWRKTKQQGQTPSMDEVKTFWKEHSFDQ